MTLLTRCPACGSADIARHCPVATCPWEKCKRRACSAVLGPGNLRGYVMVGSEARPVDFGTSS